jgi:hypothetical protein
MRYLLAFAAACSLYAQSPPCVQIVDANVWGIGNAGANGTITLSLGQALVVGDVTYPAGSATLTVTAGTLYGPDGTVGYCAPPGAALTAIYQVRRSGASGNVPSTVAWTIPSSGGPYLVKNIQTPTLNPPSAKFPATLIIPTGAVSDGTYCLQVIGGAITGVITCSGGGSGSLFDSADGNFDDVSGLFDSH